jgi:hypothetical protein
MLHLNFTLTIPWVTEDFKSLYDKSGGIGKHTSWEIELFKDSQTFFQFTLSWTARRDHAGPAIEIGVLGYIASAKIYDCRHWNHKTATWEVYE